MSRIGKNPVLIPQGVTVEIKDGEIIVKGPKGELRMKWNPLVKVVLEEGQVVVLRTSEEKVDRSIHGLTRSLVANLVEGVSKGFVKKLEINGVGYRANVAGRSLDLSLGYSHPIKFPIPEGIQIEMEGDKKNVISVSGIDKQKVGQVAAEIREFRKPEPYKGKGIKYSDEHIRRKAGKVSSK